MTSTATQQDDTKYGIHAAHDAAVAANHLRHALRRLSEDETYPDHVGLGTAANLADLLADTVDRYWRSIRPLVDADQDAA